jgi:hypothetical protein
MTVHMDADALRDSATEILRDMNGRALNRPMPSDFAARAATMGIHELRKHYHTGIPAIERWYAEAGVAQVYPPRFTPVPADFAAQCRVKWRSALAEHYGVSQTLVAKWCRRTGLTSAPAPVANRRDTPDRFAAIAPTMTVAQLKEYYGASKTLVRRWCADEGVAPRPGLARAKSGPPQIRPAQADATLAGQAAQHLRRTRIVFRCDILPAHERAKFPNRGRGLWYINGKGAVTEAEMLAMAEAKGFDPRAWARI